MSIVQSVNLASAPTYGPWTGSAGATGIDKRPVADAIRISSAGVAGDHVMDRKHHGSEFKAVYAYASEDAQWWERELDATLTPGRFGENLTLQGIDINAARIGETWRIGTALVRVTEPRIPCRVLAGFWDRPTMINDFIAAGRSGTYLAVIEAGDVRAGDDVTVVDVPAHDVTVGIAFAAKTGGEPRDALAPALPWFPPKWQDWITKGS